MIRIAITIAILAALGREAISQDAAATGARLKELVTVTGDLVRIGDLVDNAGTAAGVAVFRAPDLGQTGTVQVARIAEALRAHEITGLDAENISEVVVTRLSRALTAKDIEDRIARALAGQRGFGDAKNLVVTIDRDVRTMHVEATATADLLISRMSIEPRSGRFDVAFELPGSAVARRLPLRFTGTAVETVEVATAARPLARGDILRDGDVAMERRPKPEAGGETIGIEQVVGLAAKRALRPGQVLRSSDLMKPELVHRNETVTIHYEVPGIVLTVRGKALEAGAGGELVSVLNIQSKRTIQATVTGPGQVTIAATAPRVAAAAAAGGARRTQ